MDRTGPSDRTASGRPDGTGPRARPPRRRVLPIVAVLTAACLVALAILHHTLYRLTWRPDGFFVREFETITGATLREDAEVIWKWAAPSGLDGSSHYVTAAIVGSGFEIASLGPEFVTPEDCRAHAGGARRFLAETSALECRRRGSADDSRAWLLVLRAPEEDVLLYKRSSR